MKLTQKSLSIIVLKSQNILALSKTLLIFEKNTISSEFNIKFSKLILIQKQKLIIQNRIINQILR